MKPFRARPVPDRRPPRWIAVVTGSPLAEGAPRLAAAIAAGPANQLTYAHVTAPAHTPARAESVAGNTDAGAHAGAHDEITVDDVITAITKAGTDADALTILTALTRRRRQLLLAVADQLYVVADGRRPAIIRAEVIAEARS
jgi:hypothetical protein